MAPGAEIDINRSVALDLSLSYLGQQTDALARWATGQSSTP